MPAIVKDRAVHSGNLERWLGKENVQAVSDMMADWYGPPIALGGVPGKVFAHRGGDFRGQFGGGKLASAIDVADGIRRRLARAVRRASLKQASTLNAGFASLNDLISEATSGGKRYSFQFQKVGTTGVVSATNSLWAVGNQPVAGANGSAAPGGRAPTSATTGAIPYTNPTGGDTLHIVRADIASTVAANTLLIYDRIFDVAKTMNSTATEAVSGTPSRYQSTTGGAIDSAEGNFLFVECTTVLAATAHNWTTCTYTDQSGNTGVTLPSLTGNSGNIVNRLDHPTGQWFAPLAGGDTGIKNLTQMQCSAAVATGAINFVIGHPLMIVPCPIANFVQPIDGVLGFFGLNRIFDSACLSFLEITKSATGATTYVGTFDGVAG